MDEMKITSGFTRGIISKLVRSALRKKFGWDIDLELNAIEATVIDGKTHIHLDLDAKIEKEELLNILKTVGLS